MTVIRRLRTLHLCARGAAVSGDSVVPLHVWTSGAVILCTEVTMTRRLRTLHVWTRGAVVPGDSVVPLHVWTSGAVILCTEMTTAMWIPV